MLESVHDQINPDAQEVYGLIEIISDGTLLKHQQKCLLQFEIYVNTKLFCLTI